MGKIKKRMVSVMAAALIVPVVFTMPSVASADGLFSGTASGQEEKEDHVVTINGTEYGSGSFTEEGFFNRNKTEADFTEGETVGIIAKPDSNAHLSEISVTAEDGTDVEYGISEDGNINFDMPDQNVSVSLAFVMDKDWMTDVTIVEGEGAYEPSAEDILITDYDTGYDGTGIVARGDDWEDIISLLPEEISVTLEDGTDTYLPVSWDSPARAAYEDDPENVTSLAFLAELPEGYVMDPSDSELKVPVIILKVEDPYGISTMAVSSGYLSKGGTIYYGGWSTHRYTFNGNEAYCGNPSAKSPSSGTYSVRQIYQKDLAAALWYGYGGPGFTELMWPSKWYDGSAMTADKYRALTHIMIADIYSYDASYAYGQCNQDFRQWVSYHIIGYGSYGAQENPTAVRRLIGQLQFAYTDAYNTWPAGFNIYEVYTGSGSQVMLAWDYDWSENPAYSSTSYTAREALAPSLDIHVEKKDADTGKSLQGAEFTVYMDNKEAGKITTDASGQAAYHWRGSTLYTAYRTSSVKQYCVNYDRLNAENKQAVNNNSSVYNYIGDAYNAAKNEITAQVDADLSALKSNTKHTWKVVETKAPDGYELNKKVWEQTLSANTTVIEVDFTDVSEGVPVKIQKSSGNTSLTEGNDCYSLEGAEYGIYASRDDAMNDENRVATLTTDVNGETDEVEIKRGTWFVKEVKASPGFLLCDGSTGDGADRNGIHVITIDGTEELVTVKCSDPPADDPFRLTLYKMDYDTAGDAQGTASLEGAVFEVTQYTNTAGDVSGKAYRTWYFKTDAKGKLYCNDKAYLIPSFTTNTGTVYQSDELYTDGAGNIIYPVGTYQIREISAPKYYRLEGYMQFTWNPDHRADVTEGLKLVIRQDQNGESPVWYDGEDLVDGAITAGNPAVNVYDKVSRGSVTIFKQKADGTKEPLSGVTFRIQGVEEGDEHTATTGEDGKVVWNNLIPQEYVITEIKTQDGYSLLKDNIEVKLPVEMTLDEINRNGADIDQAVFDEAAQKYCFYDVTFTVSDSLDLQMPFTGGDQKRMYLLLAVGITAVGIGTTLLLRRRRKVKQ